MAGEVADGVVGATAVVEVAAGLLVVADGGTLEAVPVLVAAPVLPLEHEVTATSAKPATTPMIIRRRCLPVISPVCVSPSARRPY